MNAAFAPTLLINRLWAASGLGPLRLGAKNRSLRGKFKTAKRMISLGACAKIDFGASPYEPNFKRSAKSTISTTKRARGISPDPSLPTANLPCAVTHKKVDSESVFFTN